MHKEITYLKSIYPNAGRIYGQLSQFSHFDAKTHPLFYAKQNGEIAVRMADRGTKFIAMHWPFYLADIFIIVFEEFYISRIKKLKALTRSGKLKSKRFTVKYRESYFKGFEGADAQNLFS